MRLTRLLAAVVAGLVCFPAPADLIITDPATGPTTATNNGVAVAVDPNLTVNLSVRVLPDGQVSWSCYPSLPGPNNYGPVWVAAQEDGGVYCAFTGCTSGRLGWHNQGGPLADDPSFAGVRLDGRVGQRVIITRDTAGVTFRVIDPPSLFTILDDYFTGRLTLDGLFDALAEWFAR